MAEEQIQPTLVNLDNFDAGGKVRKIDSPRSHCVVTRLGYTLPDLIPRPVSCFFTKGVDINESAKLKADAYEAKRVERVAEARDEYRHCREFTKYAPLSVYAELPVKKHWVPATGDPTGAKAKKAAEDKMQALLSTGGGSADEGKKGDTAIRMMAEAAANKASQMVEADQQKVEAIKRRQKKEIDRVVENEGRMATLQAKILKAENDEAERRKQHEKDVAENKKAEIKRKQERDLESKKKLDEEILERNRIAAKEMEVERKLAEREKEEEKVRRKQARENEMYVAKMKEEQDAKTAKIFSDLEAMAQRNREKIEERNARILRDFEEKKAKKEQEIKDNRSKAEKRIQKAKDIAKKIQVDKKVNFDKKVADHIALREAELEKNRDKVEAAAKALLDKQKRQKDAYDTAKLQREDFRAKTIKLSQDRDGYYEEVQKIEKRKQIILSTTNEIRQKEVLDNVDRINRIHSAVQQQRLKALMSDDERTEMIRDAKLQLIHERKEIAHDANMRKWRVNECMEKMRMTNKYTNLEKQLDAAMNNTGGKKTISPKQADDDWDDHGR